jgi:hypothetical protein
MSKLEFLLLIRGKLDVEFEDGEISEYDYEQRLELIEDLIREAEEGIKVPYART